MKNIIDDILDRGGWIVEWACDNWWWFILVPVIAILYIIAKWMGLIS